MFSSSSYTHSNLLFPSSPPLSLTALTLSQTPLWPATLIWR
ncbi:hypothetical protein M8C21_017130 [Ambrosia artemisiifolia]|uniref:Uncharacterized protein n=1 Tax=Ambrosia artemisiifolia TaxID=4212 RepID=A0AAD5GZ33_AMBAR|nr:hypothetical protein M8C21_017130 [Ambrosia artemisiifolia]